MKPDFKHNKCGIYCIRNLFNNKVYIGKSKNIYKRIHQHLYALKNNKKDENPYLQNAWNKYGEDAFEYFVLEFLELNEVLVAERELFWIKIYNSLETGYNLRSDSDSKMITHEKTSKKISNRLKKEWKKGLRKDHSEKLSKNWENNAYRKALQSKLFTKTKTKYLYLIDNQYLNYQDLIKMNLKSALGAFSEKKSNEIYFKNVFIKRVKVEDIVQTEEKSSD
jgi:group I intron endonuclease